MTDSDDGTDVERELAAAVTDVRRRARSPDDRREFLAAVCERLVESGLYAFAWYGKLDIDAERPDPIATAATDGEAVPEAAIEAATETDLAAASFRNRSVRAVTDLSAAPAEEARRRLVADHGIDAVATAPVMPADAGVPYGALTVYTRRPDAFGDDETALLSDVATAVGRGIEAVDAGRITSVEDGDLRIDGITRAIPGLLFIHDAEGRYEEVLTPQYVRNFTKPEDMVGRTVHDVLPDDVADRIQSGIDRALETGDTQEVEYALEVAGEEVWIAARIAPLDPSIDDRVVFVGRHITERKERERELERQNERLEEFASIVSHDLRNPLSVAQGRLELARTECDSDHLDAMERALGRMEALIDDLLTLARGGDDVDRLEPLSLAEMAERCWETVATADATLVVETDRTLRADRGRLQQLLENLVRNAIEHGGRDVTVTVGDLAGGFYVADDGPGIPPDERDRVFDAGYSTADDGTGFGLNIVSEIADAHGWSVAVTDGDAGGARFEVTGVDRVA